MSEWQPIETAPKDGTRILLGGGWYDDEAGGPVRVSMVARWAQLNRGTHGWLIAEREGGYNNVTYDDPTHWMPVPDPPNPA
jgi:hypothetical protein